MQITYLKKFKELFSEVTVTSVIFFIVGSFGIVFLFYMSQVYWRVSWYSIPDFTISYLLRTFLIAVSVSAIAISLRTTRLKARIEFSQNQIIAIRAMIALAVVSFLLCTLFPDTARRLGEEDNLIEWISFVVLFLSMAMILLILKKYLSLKNAPIIFLSLLFFALLLFIMGMEEISWGQRIFGISTPEKFEGNSQNELNLHNFVTTEADTLYYIGLCILFIILPYLKMCFPTVFSNKFFQLLIPGPYIVLIGALTFAFHYNKWNLLFTQIWFFSALVIILILAFYQMQHSTGRFFFLAAFLIFFMQVVFLAGDNSNPVLLSGRISEYKELISQAALLVYSGDVFQKVKNPNTVQEGYNE